MVITYTKISGHQVLAALIGKFFGISVQEVSAEEAEQIADPFKYLYDVWVKCRESYTLKKLKENTTIPPVLAVFSPISVEATNDQRAQWQEIAKAVETFIVLEFSEFETDADALKRAFGMLYVVDQSEIRLPIAEIISTGRAYCRSFELLERKRAKAVADLKTLLTESADADFSEEVKSLHAQRFDELSKYGAPGVAFPVDPINPFYLGYFSDDDYKKLLDSAALLAESASANAVQNPEAIAGDAELKNFKAPEEEQEQAPDFPEEAQNGPGPDIDELKDKVD